MKILQICFRVPFPPHDGGAMAMYSITRGLHKKGHEVTVLAFNTPKHFQDETVLQDIATLYTVFVDTTVSFFGAFMNLFKEIPYNLERFISEKFERELQNVLLKEKFDVVHFEGMYVAWYIQTVKKISSVPTVLRTHNLEHRIWERLAKNEKNIFKKWYLKNLSKKLKKFEEKYFNQFNAIASISSEDAKVIKALSTNKRVDVIPFGVEVKALDQAQEFIPQSKTMFIISALEWQPNVEGLEWFLESVWPVLHKSMPDLQLHIAGKRTPEKILNLKTPNVVVHGFVPDAFEFMCNYDLMLVPLLSGSGIRIKILEGMAAKKCIVTSSVGAEGLEYEDHKNLLIANSSGEWVKLISEYFLMPEKYGTIGSSAFQLVEEKYRNDIVSAKLIDLYKKLQ